MSFSTEEYNELKNEFIKLKSEYRQLEDQFNLKFNNPLNIVSTINDSYKNIVDNANEGIIVSQNHHIKYANPFLEKLTEYSLQELIGRRFSEFIHPEDVDLVLEMFYKRIKGEINTNKYYFRIITKSGLIKLLEVHASIVQWDNAPASLGFLIDITERKKDEEILNESQEKYFLIMENSSEAIFIIQDGVIVLANNIATSFIDFEMEEIINRPFAEFIHPEDLRIVLENYYKRMENKNPLNKYPFRIITKFGKIKWVEVNAILINWHSKPATLNFLSDISTKIHTENELLKAKLKAEERDNLKTAYLNNISHEIRTPVHGIIGFSQFLNEEDLSKEERNEFLTIINNSCQHLLSVVNNVLDISKIDAGQMDINESEFRIRLLFEEIYEEQINQFKNKNLGLSFTLQKDLDSLLFISDRYKIQQILNSLITNAFMITESGEIEYGCNIESNTVEFFVKGTGVGNSKMYINNSIFTSSNAYKNKKINQSENFGLGLTLAKGLIELLGGKINYTTNKGSDYNFKFALPLKTIIENNISNENIGKVQDIEDYSKFNILVAEDDLYNFLMLEHVITKELGAKVLHATDGKIALDICKNHPNISLILMDIRMPYMDGYTTAKKIKKINPKIPIIAVTALSMQSDSRKAIEAGCDDYIYKPINPIDLTKKIKIWLSYFS